MRWPALALLALGACMSKPAPVAEKPKVINPGPETVISFTRPGTHASQLIHDLAARCWLDGIVRGAQLFVTPMTGEVRIVGETETLLVGTFLTAQQGKARLRLTGTAIKQPAMVAKLRASVDRAVRTGETACKRAT